MYIDSLNYAECEARSLRGLPHVLYGRSGHVIAAFAELHDAEECREALRFWPTPPIPLRIKRLAGKL